jgi:hypothetical protein
MKENDDMSAHTQQPEEIELDFKPGEEDFETADFDQKPEEPEAAKEEISQQEEIEIIIGKEPKVWVIGPEEASRTFIQKELSFISKAQWFSLIGDVLDKALSGPSGISLNSLMSTPGRPGALSARDFRDADTFVQAIGKLLSVAPNFLVDSYLIWLNVPDYDRDLVRDLMKLPPDEGGLSDEQGMGMIETFLDQNYDSLASFFGERLLGVQARVRKLAEDRESRRSKR